MQLCSTLSRKNASDSVDNSFAVVFETFNAAPAEKIRHYHSRTDRASQGLVIPLPFSWPAVLQDGSFY